jgi:hypothetical protein
LFCQPPSPGISSTQDNDNDNDDDDDEATPPPPLLDDGWEGVLVDAAKTSGVDQEGDLPDETMYL